jgi:hypothetical protein
MPLLPRFGVFQNPKTPKRYCTATKTMFLRMKFRFKTGNEKPLAAPRWNPPPWTKNRTGHFVGEVRQNPFTKMFTVKQSSFISIRVFIPKRVAFWRHATPYDDVFRIPDQSCYKNIVHFVCTIAMKQTCEFPSIDFGGLKRNSFIGG